MEEWSEVGACWVFSAFCCGRIRQMDGLDLLLLCFCFLHAKSKWRPHACMTPTGHVCIYYNFLFHLCYKYHAHVSTNGSKMPCCMHVTVIFIRVHVCQCDSLYLLKEGRDSGTQIIPEKNLFFFLLKKIIDTSIYAMSVGLRPSMEIFSM